MDLFEKINRSFGNWYEGLFGGGDDVRPKDILRRILAAMEDHRKEGFDSRIYVPNQYILEINVKDEEEKEYLLSFLNRDELEAAIRRYCKQNNYHIRGPLDFTVKEVEETDGESSKRGEKFRVRCRYNTQIMGAEEPKVPAAVSPKAPPSDDRTVANVRGLVSEEEESGTVPAVAHAVLIVYAPDKAPFRYTIARGAVAIGRSRSSGNDLIIETDGQISKRHARIEMETDGRFSIYDLGSTNGVKVNGRRVDNRTLNDGDEIVLGTTRLTFQVMKRNEVSGEGTVGASAPPKSADDGRILGGAAARLHDPGSSVPPARTMRAHTARVILRDGEQDVDDFLLASETSIGRGVTNDIVLPDKSVATRHARILFDGSGYTLESLTDAPTACNDETLRIGESARLMQGDTLRIGDLSLRFDSGTEE